MIQQDQNDHTPTFSHSVYNASIREDAKIGSLVINLNATDADSSLNGKVIYEILSGNERNTFAISATAGGIRTQDLLDRETTNLYELQVSIFWYLKHAKYHLRMFRIIP